jgi:hypothetical protein
LQRLREKYKISQFSCFVLVPLSSIPSKILKYLKATDLELCCHTSLLSVNDLCDSDITEISEINEVPIQSFFGRQQFIRTLNCANLKWSYFATEIIDLGSFELNMKVRRALN